MRKRPTQDRAQRTVEAIFKATAQIVDKEGLEALSTNKIAAKAGFSVGTLYQYFASREAVLEAMIDSERQRVIDEIHGILRDVVEGRIAPREALRLRIRALISAFGTGDRLSRAIVRMAWRMDFTDTVLQAQRESAEHIAIVWSQIGREGMRPLTPATLFVGTRAVMGAIRSASLENSPLLGTQDFEDELVHLVWGLTRP